MNKIEQYKARLSEKFKKAEEKQLLNTMFDHAAFLYDSLKRYSGESYLERSLRVTVDKILGFNPDLDTVIAAVLMSATYSPKCDLDKIEKLFGNEVRILVETLGKINNIKARNYENDFEVIGKMFLTLSKDFRVILIRLAERIDNLETLEFKSVDKQKANAKEILEVYVPIANRLGLYDFKLALEDLAFKYVYPNEYHNVKKDIDAYLSKSRQSIAVIIDELKSLMKENGFEVNVSGRLKSIYSIYNKLKKKACSISDLFDVFAYRIILNENVEEKKSEERLYEILSLLHKKYKYLSERFKDYVTSPKANGYRSLHTALIGLDWGDSQKPVEVQIRTLKMHDFAEHGNAAHWFYKEGGNQVLSGDLLKLMADLKKNINDEKTTALKIDLYSDRIFVMTPNNLVKELPLGSTPVDFAYSIHSDIGHACYLAKVNGQVAPLSHELKSGDIVEIVTGSKKEPKFAWLSFVKTKHAKIRIKNFFKGLGEDDVLLLGKDRLNEVLQKTGLETLDENYSFLKRFQGKNQNFQDRELIIKEIGGGKYTAGQVFRLVMEVSVEKYLKSKEKELERKAGQIVPKTNNLNQDSRVKDLIIGGEGNMPYRISNCCKPALRDDIVAYVTMSKGISIHLRSCSFVKSANREKLLEVENYAH